MFAFPWDKEVKPGAPKYKLTIVEETEDFALISAPHDVRSGSEVLAFMQFLYDQGYEALFENPLFLVCKKRRK